MTTDTETAVDPILQQYREIKALHPESILLFRKGDFYELFYDDAKSMSRLIGLTLTTRRKSSANPIPMAGFPYHQLDGYVAKIVRSGFRVAICEDN